MAHRKKLCAALAVLVTACGGAPEQAAPPAVPDWLPDIPLVTPPAPAPVQAFEDGAIPAGGFPDPGRRAKLASAFPEIDRIFAEFREKEKVPGLAYGVVVDGELVHAKGTGVRDVDTKAPVDTDTVFRIASMTKSFTAAAVLRLRDDGKLSLDDPADKYLPELARLRYPTHDSPRITVRDLLSHGAGLPEDNPSGDRWLAWSDDQLGRAIEGGLPFSTAPGTAYEYSNLGFMLAGRLVGRLAGMRYRDYVTATFLRPLGMTSSGWEDGDVPADHVAIGYRRDGDTWVKEPRLPDGVGNAMGGLYASVRDLARYLAFQLDAWPPRDDADTAPLRRSSRREMQRMQRDDAITVQRVTPDEPTIAQAIGYGFGWSVQRSCAFDRIVAHGGGLPGFGSFHVFLPDHGVGVIALTNLTYHGPVRAAREALLALRRTGGLVKRTVLPSKALLAVREGIAAMIERFDETAVGRIASENFFLDKSAARRKEEIDKLRAAHGACRVEGDVDAENALRGTWRMACEKGWLTVRATLAPTMPPRVQWLEIAGAMPLDARAAKIAESAAALVARWDDAAFARIAGPKIDRAKTRRAFADAATNHVSCAVDRVLSGDGRSAAIVALHCAREPARLEIEIDDRTGKLTALTVAPAPWPLGRCAR
jgi:CubicO group peptidase (beta-lactamase class C family)